MSLIKRFEPFHRLRRGLIALTVAAVAVALIGLGASPAGAQSNGLYVGAYGGWNNTTLDYEVGPDDGSESSGALRLSGRLGWQLSILLDRLVLGGELALAQENGSFEYTTSVGGQDVDTAIDLIASGAATAHAGWTFAAQTQVYGLIGYRGTFVEIDASGGGSDLSDQPGALYGMEYGLGVRQDILLGWQIGAEYRYTDYQGIDYTLEAGGQSEDASVDAAAQTFMLGVVYDLPIL